MSPGDPGERGPEFLARKSVAAIFNMIKSVCATDLMADMSPPIYDKFWYNRSEAIFKTECE